MDEPAQAFEAGEILLGKLRVIRVLGEGGMGAVYEVEHSLTKHRRALKVLHPKLSRDADITTRLLREASVAGRLRSKHVVETFDAGQLENGAAYVLMEMLEGHPLSSELARGPMSVARLSVVISQVCDALRAAHQAGIVHRDLKPDNIFVARELDGTECVKLLDFGISKFTTTNEDPAAKLTQDGLVMGTPYYMSPEQTRDAGQVDARTDIYALGVIMYEAIAGRPPFAAESFPRLFVLIHLGQYEPLRVVAPGVEPAFEAIVDKAMGLKAEDRFQTATELRAAVAPFVERAPGLMETLAAPVESLSPPSPMAATRDASESADDEPEEAAQEPAREPPKEAAEEEEPSTDAEPTVAPSKRRPVAAFAVAAVVVAVLGVALASTGGLTSSGADEETPDPAPAIVAPIEREPVAVEPVTPTAISPPEAVEPIETDAGLAGAEPVIRPSTPGRSHTARPEGGASSSKINIDSDIHF